MPRPRELPKTHILTANVLETQARALRELSKRLDRSMSDLVREAIDLLLQKYRKLPSSSESSEKIERTRSRRTVRQIFAIEKVSYIIQDLKEVESIIARLEQILKKVKARYGQDAWFTIWQNVLLDERHKIVRARRLLAGCETLLTKMEQYGLSRPDLAERVVKLRKKLSALEEGRETKI